MARPSNTAQRREQIVGGLRQVLPSLGYERASVNAIAKAAQLSPGLVHYHFKSKQQILLALTDTLALELQQRVSGRLEGLNDPRQRVNAWIDALLALDEQADPWAVACWVLIGAEATRIPALRERYELAMQAQLEQLSALLQDALPGPDAALDASRMAPSLLASVMGAFHLASAAPEAFTPGSAAPNLRRLVGALLDGAA